MESVFDMTQLLVFVILSAISLAAMIYLLIEQSDVVDMPLVPFFLTTCMFGVIGAIMTLSAIELTYILITATSVSIGIFLVSYYGFKSIITKPEDPARFVGKKAIVEINVDYNSTGRIKTLDVEHPAEFPAKANRAIPKHQEVIIERFSGSVAFVIPVPNRMHVNSGHLIQCKRCKSSIEINIDFCPYCGEKNESL